LLDGNAARCGFNAAAYAISHHIQGSMFLPICKTPIPHLFTKNQGAGRAFLPARFNYNHIRSSCQIPHINNVSSPRSPHSPKRKRVVEPPVVLVSCLKRRPYIHYSVVSLHESSHLHVDVRVIHRPNLRSHVGIVEPLWCCQPPIRPDSEYLACKGGSALVCIHDATAT
jgi:hypothetical protein